MKEYLTGAAMLLIFAIFLAQFTTNQITHDKLLLSENDIASAMEEVRREGCITEAIEEELKDKLLSDIDSDIESDVLIESSKTDRVLRGELIDYVVTLKLRNVYPVGGNRRADYITKVFSGSVASEYIGD